MSKFWNITIPVLCVGIASAAIYWQVHKAKVTEQTLSEKERLCRISADRGDAQGQYCLGSAYYYGQSVPRDYAEAMSWYRKAVDQGDAKA
jgi:TPR repeat protein